MPGRRRLPGGAAGAAAGEGGELEEEVTQIVRQRLRPVRPFSPSLTVQGYEAAAADIQSAKAAADAAKDAEFAAQKATSGAQLLNEVETSGQATPFDYNKPL